VGMGVSARVDIVRVPRAAPVDTDCSCVTAVERTGMAVSQRGDNDSRIRMAEHVVGVGMQQAGGSNMLARSSEHSIPPNTQSQQVGIA
jgi:hypothetical protein